MNRAELSALAAAYGTPLYVFDTDALSRRTALVRDAFSNAVRLCYSIKANPFLTGCAPTELLEVCSPGELAICRALRVPPERILLSGVSKTERDVADALDYGVRTLTAESPLHAERIEAAAAQRGLTVDLLLRLTGGDQFGMDEAAVRELVRGREAFKHLRMQGLHFFSGTQKKNKAAAERELTMLADFADGLERDFGFAGRRLEYGAGLFADYFGADAAKREEQLLLDVAPFVRRAAERFALTVEMGRFFAASCGYYLTSVADVKVSDGRNIAIVDGGSHQIQYDGLLLAPAPPPVTLLSGDRPADGEWTVYGSLCSRGDILARGVKLPALRLSDVLCFGQAGAYAVTEGMALFLSRDLPAVVLWNQSGGASLLRGHLSTHLFNTPFARLEE